MARTLRMIDIGLRLLLGVVFYWLVSSLASGGWSVPSWLANAHYQIYEFVAFVATSLWCYATGSWLKDRIFDLAAWIKLLRS